MLFPTARMVDGAWRGVVMPVLGPKTELREPWGPAAAEELPGACNDVWRMP